MKANIENREYEDGEIVLITYPTVPIPDEVLNDPTPPFEVSPLAHAA